MISVYTQIQELDEQVVQSGYARPHPLTKEKPVNKYGEECECAWNNDWLYVIQWDNESDELEAEFVAARLETKMHKRYDDGFISFIVVY